ncbi:GNAT family N-acetyltransferase [uncultured Thomasclavelia sp.]|uniref:GNAT family N-acetyltransferase n=1 Tax=uncultured Thomasclavelia sp. TaxID=3025759 RepID=UPI0025CCFBD7|nr:GNAT family N-acetyltransferase [uncultured Thomasclavelia sp.]
MQNSPVLETKRFILRKFNNDDLNDLHEILSDEIVNAYLPWFVSKTLEDTKQFMKERIYHEYQQDVAYFYAIEAKDTHKVIGYVDITDIDLKEKCGDLGYGINRLYWNQGIASEVSQVLLQQLKEDGFAFITATCDQNNIGSGRVMQKCGMWYMYSYQEQWQPKDITVIFRLYQINLDGNEKRVFKKYWDMYPVHFIEDSI